MKTLLVAVATISMLIGVLVATIVAPDDVLGRKHSFPKMAKATYFTAGRGTGADVPNLAGVKEVVALCDAGDVLLTGGLLNLDAGTQIESLDPQVGNQRFVARFRPSGADEVTVTALCSDFPPAHP